MENISMLGRVIITNGEQVREINNTIMTTGRSESAIRLVSGNFIPPEPFCYLAIGTGSSIINSSGLILGNEFMRLNRLDVTGSTTTTNTLNDTAKWIGSFLISGNAQINEAGIFNKSGLDLGSILSRTVFNNLNALSGDTINLTWTVQFI